MSVKLGEKYLISTDEWFIAPDGQSYRSVFGTVTGVHGDDEILNIKTNAKSTNWFVIIGNMIIAGCQIHYCIKTDEVSFRPPTRDIEQKGKLITDREACSRIYDADQ